MSLRIIGGGPAHKTGDLAELVCSYMNIPLDRQCYERFVRDLRELPKHEPFEGCLPIEEMAARGEDTLRFGPMKPVGLRDPRTGVTPYAVVQLRKENVEGTAYNLVGFQTRLTWPAQKAAFGRFPGLEQAEWLRLGVMHRNSFIDAPALLLPDLRLRGAERLWFAGQITGAEGYVEGSACGLIAGIAAARSLMGLPEAPVPRDTALGAVVAHLQWAYFGPGEGPVIRDKRERRRRMAERALARVEVWKAGMEIRNEPPEFQSGP